MADNPFAGVFSGSPAPKAASPQGNPFTGMFTPSFSGVPNKGDTQNLTSALGKLSTYNNTDQRTIVTRATRAGLIDKNKGADAIQQLLNEQKVPDFKVNKREQIISGLAHGVAEPFQYAATGIAHSLGADKPTSGQKAADSSLASGQQSLIDALHKPGLSQQKQSKLIDTINSLYDPGKAAQNTKQLESETNKRRFVSSAYQVGLTPFALSSPTVGNVYKAGEGLKAAELAGKAKTAWNIGSSAGLGALQATGGEKLSAKEIAKQAAIGAILPAAAHGLEAGIGALRGGERAAPAIGDIAAHPATSAAIPKTAKISDLKIGSDAIGPVDKARVAEYKARIDNGGKIEPLVVQKTPEGMFVQDGKHRLMAAQQAGLRDVPIVEKNAAVESPELKLSVPGERTPYTPEVSKTLDKIDLSKPLPGKGVGSEIKNLFTPGGGLEGKQIANDLRATTGEQALAKNQETLAAKSDVNFFKGMSPGEHANFIQKIESGVKQDTPELQQMADKLRTAQESDFKIAQTLKPTITKVENYFPRAGFWDNSSKQVDDFVNKFQQNTLGGKATALESRSFPTVYDGIKAGLVPKETNPAIIALNSRTQLLKAKAAQDFFDQQVKLGRDPALVKEYIDRVIGKGLESSPTYQTAKQAGYAINNLQLSLSGFHVSGTGINAVVSQFSNGIQDLAHGNLGKGVVDIAKSPVAPLDYLFKGNKILKDYKAGNVTQDIKNIAEGGGRIGAQVDYRATGLAKSIDQLKNGSLIEKVKGVASAPTRAFSEAAKPIMDWWVPRIKAGATKELIDRKLAELGPNASAEAVRAAKAEAIDSVDNRFGQLVKDNLLWKKTIKDGSSLMMRSPGWNIGTVREIGGGLTDLATKTARGKGLSERSAYTASLAATSMMMGTAISYMFTGKGPQNPIDYFYPKTGKIDKNGNEERVALPTYAKDIFSFTHNPGQTIANKASPAISLGSQLAKNRDYYGNMIRNPEDSAKTQLKQTGSYLGKSLLPFSISGANQRVDKGASTKVQSFFGLNPAPGYITKSPFEQKVASALNQSLGSKPLTPEESKKVTDKSNAKQPNPAPSDTSLSKAFTYLMKVNEPEALKLYKTASPNDKAKLQGVSQSSLEKAINDTTLRKSGINPKTGKQIIHRVKK